MNSGEINYTKPSAHPLRFPKSQRLHHRSLVEGLFRNGKSLYDYPLRMVYRSMSPQQLDDNFCNCPPKGIAPVQMMVTVPKKKRRHAVDRVLMRRRIREAFRLNRNLIPDSGDNYLQIAFIFLHGDNSSYANIEKKMQRLLKKISVD